MNVWKDVEVNTEGFHHMYGNQWIPRYLLVHCDLLTQLRRERMNFLFAIDLILPLFCSNICSLFIKDYAYAK